MKVVRKYITQRLAGAGRTPENRVFTSGYPATNRVFEALLYGAASGFMIYVVTELANRSGSLGVFNPAFAATATAFAAIVIGMTVLWYKDGRRA